MPFSPTEYARWYCEKYAPSPGRLQKRLQAKFPDQMEVITAIITEYTPLAERLVEGSIDMMRRGWYPWRKIAEKLRRADWDKAFIEKILIEYTCRDHEDDWSMIRESLERKYAALMKKWYSHAASIRTLCTLFPEHKTAIRETYADMDNSLETIQVLIAKKYPHPRDEKTRARATRYLAGRGYGWDEITTILQNR